MSIFNASRLPRSDTFRSRGEIEGGDDNDGGDGDDGNSMYLVRQRHLFLHFFFFLGDDASPMVGCLVGRLVHRGITTAAATPMDGPRSGWTTYVRSL